MLLNFQVVGMANRADPIMDEHSDIRRSSAFRVGRLLLTGDCRVPRCVEDAFSDNPFPLHNIRHCLYLFVATDGLVLTGCQDKLIRAYSGTGIEPVLEVAGHEVRSAPSEPAC
jgi:hypothetical protein